MLASDRSFSTFMKTSLLLTTAFLVVSSGPLLAADSFAGAFEKDTVLLNARLRCEGVQQTNLRDASALTLRTRSASPRPRGRA